MPTVILSDQADANLKRLVTDPFEQTRESIIEDLIETELARRATCPQVNGHAAAESDHLIRLDPDRPANLRHSRIIAATVGGGAIHRPKWNGIREEMHVLALKRLGDLKKVATISDANVQKGKREDIGFSYVPDGDFSIQGVESNWCWTHTLRLARALNVPVRLEIEWRDKDGAAHPGQRGVLEWKPTQN